MEKIIVHTYPLETEVNSRGEDLLALIDEINASFQVLIRWKFVEEKLKIFFYFNENNTFLARCIVNYLNFNKYQFDKEYASGIKIEDVVDYNKKSWTLKFKEDSGSELNKPQLFSVISYLKQESCELNCWIHKNADTKEYTYKLFCCYEEGIRIPSPIVAGFSFRSYWQHGTGEFENFSLSSLLPLFSLPIAYDGMKGLLYGYEGNASAKTDIDAKDKDFIVVGKIVNHSMDYHLTLKPSAFSYMTSIWGVPGGGKTILSLSLVSQLWNDCGIPSLIIEPSKHEYRALANVLKGGVNLLKDLKGINILIPPKGIDVYAWSEVIVMLIDMSCQMPSDSSWPGYYRRAYVMAATLDAKGATPRKMFKCLNTILASENYTGVQAGDFIKAGRSRLRAFFSYFNGSEENWNQEDDALKLRPLDMEDLFKTPTVVELASITTPKLKSAYVYLIIQHVYAYIQQRHSEADKLENLLLLEEAHNILRTTANQEVLNNVANILAEARALKMGVLISDQSPKVLDPSCVSMAQNVFAFKIVDQEDREIITHTTNGNVERLLDLPRGVCLSRTHFMHDVEYIKVSVNSDFLKNITSKADESNITYLYQNSENS